ncbi:metal ABC transporter substrate-binding protein [Anaeromicropila herbilytica]|uniref:ABC transporter substrate-binding protein n=1 Tax=Anaeromicropila herbilytica TaxID=2785025 RepID=A0A7R7ID31_9FIRM|nr:metal ABC transporter substrate-binding protein [Anaeromicropila herbilytica]BCN31147.1 ABC transporter substrate-binding protein [Anaeromicropila herbilytica]
MKKLLSLLLILCISISLIACNSKTKETTTKDTKLNVSVSFNAMAEFAKAVGKDKVQVSTIIPAGTEPHDFEPKTADIRKLSDAKVFIYNGLGMESWADEAVQSSNNQDLVVVNASKGSTSIENMEKDEIEEHGKYDPHLWLSLKGAEVEVQNIADGLLKADPKNRDYYQKNSNDYISEIEKLYQEYNKKFKSLEKKNFVTGHAAFNYFCKDFGLEQNSVEDVFAEGEPSTKQLAELVEYCKENKVTTIFAEEMASPEISKTLANEVGAKVETIHTIESADGDMTYLERMKDNCKKIYESLAQ